MPPHAGHFLEEGAALFRPQGQGLVDHALADEEESVLRQVGRVEQVDQVAQANTLAIHEVVVLTRAIQAPAELELGEVQRDQPVGVVEDERHVGHPEGGPALRPGEHDVLGAPRPDRAALFAERPTQGVGEVAFARPIRADDGVDSGRKLDERPVGEGLEALQAERDKASRLAHDGPGSGPPTRTGGLPVSRPRGAPRAASAAAVWAARREPPVPVPITSPATVTSMTNSRA